MRIGASWVVDGLTEEPLANALVVVEKGRITQVRARLPEDRDLDFEFENATLLPGFIDVHAHFTFGTGSRSYESVMAEDSDELMVARGIENCLAHLQAGVTSARD